ncbi:DUF1707 domain-containing protein [Actinospica durhamensis]|uniref:DUF1707 domain-containing protein n=1 Tax=Actinospica durhamensis TaxID=1508375 RepID=A0A941ITT4_9ACTN|nr:DUF1707 domain-containing protein [Actinospica durhamensis]MBR7836383.1 DUF1707 domain-containing protein [Actinospica durhamensis]
MSNDQSSLRASHQDRDRVVDALRIAGGEGRLDAEELDARVESALSARTLGELAALTADLPSPTGAGTGVAAVAGAVAAVPVKDVLVVEQQGGKYVRDGRWAVPPRIEVRTKLCSVTLDFREAVITSKVVRIEMDMAHGKLVVVAGPGVVIDTDGLQLTYSKVKLRSTAATAAAATEARLRIEVAGQIKHAKVIER